MKANDRDRRDASVAVVLAKAVREGEIAPPDALRIIRHEMRRRNTNRKLAVPWRSAGAQAVIDAYASRGETPPANGSDDALHADHVWGLRAEHLYKFRTLDEWMQHLQRMRTVVCVTASENYKLEGLERAGADGPEKYVAAGIAWAGEPPPFT